MTLSGEREAISLHVEISPTLPRATPIRGHLQLTWAPFFKLNDDHGR